MKEINNEFRFTPSTDFPNGEDSYLFPGEAVNDAEINSEIEKRVQRGEKLEAKEWRKGKDVSLSQIVKRARKQGEVFTTYKEELKIAKVPALHGAAANDDTYGDDGRDAQKFETVFQYRYGRSLEERTRKRTDPAGYRRDALRLVDGNKCRRDGLYLENLIAFYQPRDLAELIAAAKHDAALQIPKLQDGTTRYEPFVTWTERRDGVRFDHNTGLHVPVAATGADKEHEEN